MYEMVKAQGRLIAEYEQRIRELEDLRDAARDEERRIGVEIDFRGKPIEK